MDKRSVTMQRADRSRRGHLPNVAAGKVRERRPIETRKADIKVSLPTIRTFGCDRTVLRERPVADRALAATDR